MVWIHSSLQSNAADVFPDASTTETRTPRKDPVRFTMDVAVS